MVHSNGLVCESASEKRQAFQGPSLIFGKGKVLAQGKCCVQGCGIRHRPRGLSKATGIPVRPCLFQG